MREDFHYYATYCAAYLAGYSHGESLAIAYSAQLVDLCSRTFLATIHAPLSAATTQLQLEMMDARTNPIALQDITRIWASFHFLPYDLFSTDRKATKRYLRKYRLICRPNGDLVADTVNLAKGKGLPAVGLAMHVLADTWAHQGFAGTPSCVINDTTDYFFECVPDGDGYRSVPVSFNHNPATPDDLETRRFTNSIRRLSESSVMMLGHGRAGHLPDYSFIRYKYLPAWADYEEVFKDNPSDYRHAFAQMVYAMTYLRGGLPAFEKKTYSWEVIAPWDGTIRDILERRQLDASADWKAFGESLSRRVIEDFDLERCKEEYVKAPDDGKDETFLGQFLLAALAQKSLVTNKIYKSGNLLAGFSVDYSLKGFKGIRDYRRLLKEKQKEEPR